MTRSRAYGIDVSGWQPGIDYKLARAGLDFAIAKVTDGTGSQSKIWAEQVAGFRDAGVPIVGGYHYIQFESKPGVSIEADARAEVRRYCDLTAALLGHPLGAEVGELPLMLDAEDLSGHSRTGAEIAEWLAHAKDESERICGMTPLLYTGFGGFWGRYAALAKADGLAAMPLVTAEYRRQVNPETDSPRFYAPWDAWSCWQYSGDPKANGLATWPGVPGNCDRDVWRDPAQLFELAGLTLPEDFTRAP